LSKATQPVNLKSSQRVRLTAGAIERLACPDDSDQVFLRDTEAPGLCVRATRAGAKSYVFETKLNRKTIRKTIGSVKAWSIESARAEARRLAVEIDRGIDPREEERKRLEVAQAERAAKAAAEQAAKDAARLTLANLLHDYVDYLKNQNKSAHRDAGNIIKLHVVDAWPEISRRMARDLTGEQLADMMRRLIGLGKRRTANKLRSYVSAAFNLARTARSNPATPQALKDYGVVYNPGFDCQPDTHANVPDKHPLSLEEMQTYWEAIKNIPGLKGGAMRLHLLTGGQRIEQLLRLKTDDFGGEDFFWLYDKKGRGSASRRHYIPITEPIKAAMRDIDMPDDGEFAISSDPEGRTHVSTTTFLNWAKAAVGDSISDFTPKRIRSGVETLLAANGVSRDIRGRLQSHGISGVQDRHYNAHDYLAEKRQALELLYALLEGRKPDSRKTPSKVG
jgi:integrase